MSDLRLPTTLHQNGLRRHPLLLRDFQGQKASVSPRTAPTAAEQHLSAVNTFVGGYGSDILTRNGRLVGQSVWGQISSLSSMSVESSDIATTQHCLSLRLVGVAQAAWHAVGALILLYTDLLPSPISQFVCPCVHLFSPLFVVNQSK